MGDIGEYWREHREYKKRRESAERMGMSMKEYRKWEKEVERQNAEQNKQAKIDRCTIKCECGKWLIDTAAHNSHKSRFGRSGHSVIERKEAKILEEIPWVI